MTPCEHMQVKDGTVLRCYEVISIPKDQICGLTSNLGLRVCRDK